MMHILLVTFPLLLLQAEASKQGKETREEKQRKQEKTGLSLSSPPMYSLPLPMHTHTHVGKKEGRQERKKEGKKEGKEGKEATAFVDSFFAFTVPLVPSVRTCLLDPRPRSNGNLIQSNPIPPTYVQ